MLEKTIRNKMIKEFKNKKILIQPIESSRTGTGILDIFYRSIHKDGWIELKKLNQFPKRKNIIEVPWRPGQMNWIKKYRKFSTNIFLFLYIENTLYIFRGDGIKETYDSVELFTYPCYRDFWKEINWDYIYDILDTDEISRRLLVRKEYI